MKERCSAVVGLLPGAGVCLAVAMVAWWLGKQVPVVGGPVMAILLGAVLGHWLQGGCWQAGIKFSSKKLLQTAIVFLGFEMNLARIAEVGRQSLFLIVSTITITLLAAFCFTKLLNIRSQTGILVGVGSAICGGSAIAATAPVIGAQNDDVAKAISTIFLFNIVAALLFPTIGQAFGLSDTGFGLWAGTAVNDTSSVVAAATTWSNMVGRDEALALATVVKLTRTLAIIPITFALALYTSRKSQEAGKFNIAKIFPWFILFFLLASVVKTFSGMPAAVSSSLVAFGKFLIVMAMVAIGLSTNPGRLLKEGKKPILLGFLCWVLLAFVSLGILKLQNNW